MNSMICDLSTFHQNNWCSSIKKVHLFLYVFFFYIVSTVCLQVKTSKKKSANLGMQFVAKFVHQ